MVTNWAADAAKNGPNIIEKEGNVMIFTVCSLHKVKSSMFIAQARKHPEHKQKLFYLI